MRTNVLQGSSTQQQLFQRMQGSGADLLFFFSYWDDVSSRSHEGHEEHEKRSVQSVLRALRALRVFV